MPLKNAIPNAKTNAAKQYKNFQVKPMTSALGAEISGLDCSILSEPAFQELKDALHTHLVIFIPQQEFSVAAFSEFSLRFGEPGDEPWVAGDEAHPNVLSILKESNEKSASSYGGVWHSDLTCLKQPPAYTLLYSQVSPPFGGDTLFSNMHLCYESLSPTMQELMAKLKGIHVTNPWGSLENANQYFSSLENVKTRDIQNTGKDMAEHPIVRTHPVTEKKSLFVNPGFTKSIAGMHKEEATLLLDYLFSLSSDVMFSCRYRWQEKTLAIWDNRCVNHRVLTDFLGFKRHMLRTTVKGEIPR